MLASRDRRPRRYAGVLVCLLLPVLATGCHSHTDRHSTTGVTSTAATDLVLSDYDRESLRLSANVETSLEAVNNAGRDCLRSRGVDDTIDEVHPGLGEYLTWPDGRDALNRRYQYVSEEMATRDGFAPPSLRDTGDYIGPPEEEWTRAVLGSGTESEPAPGSCLAEIYERFSPNKKRLDALSATIADILVSAESASEAAVREKEPVWADCMANNGLGRYRTIRSVTTRDGDENGDDLWPGKTAGNDEKNVASVSGRCMIESGYLHAVSAAEATSVNSSLREHPRLLHEWVGLMGDQIDRALNAGR